MPVSSTQVKVAQEKREHPERFCRSPRCLWKIQTGDGRALAACRRHPIASKPSEDAASRLADNLAAQDDAERDYPEIEDPFQ
jgi:hypothetical protein